MKLSPLLALRVGWGGGHGGLPLLLLLLTAGRVTAGRNAELGAQIAARQPAGSAIFVQADVLHEADIKRVVDTAVEKWGRLDILFANAGGPSLPPGRDPAAWGTVEDIDEESFKCAATAAQPLLQRCCSGCSGMARQIG